MRKLRSAALIVLVLGAGAAYGAYRYLTSESFVAHVVLSKLTTHYPQFHISLRRARLDVSTGEITINRLTLTPRDRESDGPIVTFPEILIRADREALRAGRIDARRAILSQPRLRAVRMADGRWNVADLFPLPRFSETPPEILVRGCTIELGDATNGAPPLVLGDVNLRLRPEEQRRFFVTGTFGGSHLKEAYLEGRFDLDKNEWQVEGLVEKLAVGTDLLDALPTPLAGHTQPLRGITAPVELRYRLAGGAADEIVECELEAALESGRLEMPDLPLSLKTLTAGSLAYRNGHVSGELSGRDGTFLDRRLPFGLYGVAASLSIDAEGMEGRLAGRNGVTEVQMEARFEGGDFSQPVRIGAEVKRLPLDERVYAVLPPDLRAIWKRFSPEGVVDVSLSLSRVGQAWQRQGVLTCLDGAFRFDDFPYPFSAVTGTIRDDPQRITVDLVAQAGGRPVTIEARIEQGGPAAQMMVDVAGTQIPMDSNFLAALPDPTRRVVEAMHPKGLLDIRARFSRDGGPEQTLDRSIELSLRSCSLRHEALPYPITQITGSITDRNGHWTFRNLRGYNDTAEIRANGTLQPPQRGGRFELSLSGSGIAFEEELRRALPPKWAAVWAECNPMGTGHFAARIESRPGEPVRVTHVQVQLAGASLRLRAFPYQWYNVRGLLVVHDGEVEIHDLVAEHEQLRLRTDGRIARTAAGGYLLRLEALDAEQVQLDGRLLDALPERLANLNRDLELRGRIDVRDAVLELHWSGRRGDPARARWDVNVLLSDNSLRLGRRFEHVNGLVHVVGSYDGNTARGRGTIEVASLSLMGLQLTNVVGPFDWRGNDVTFGSDVWATGPQRPGETKRKHVNARLLDGTITADAVFRRDKGSFQLLASLRGARLEQYAKEYMPDRQRLAGGLSGHVRLEGRRGAANSLRGHGVLRVEQGDLYELPLVLALLNIASLQFPDTTAFTDAAASFKLGPDEVTVSRIELRGDAVTLIGQGSASYNRRLKLTFYSMVGRDTIEIPIVTEMFRQASEQLLAIDVTGPFDNPQARARPVPQVSATVRELLNLGRAR